MLRPGRVSGHRIDVHRKLRVLLVLRVRPEAVRSVLSSAIFKFARHHFTIAWAAAGSD